MIINHNVLEIFNKKNETHQNIDLTVQNSPLQNPHNKPLKKCT